MEPIVTIYIFTISLLGMSVVRQLITNDFYCSHSQNVQDHHDKEKKYISCVIFYSNIKQIMTKLNKLEQTNIEYSEMTGVPKYFIKNGIIYYFEPCPHSNQIDDYTNYLKDFLKPSVIMWNEESPPMQPLFVNTIYKISKNLRIEPIIFVDFN